MKLERIGPAGRGLTNAHFGHRDIASLLIMIGILREFCGAFFAEWISSVFLVELIFDFKVVK